MHVHGTGKSSEFWVIFRTVHQQLENGNSVHRFDPLGEMYRTVSTKINNKQCLYNV